MSRQEALWFGLFLLGMALVAVERGWKQVCWNVGIGILAWQLGKAMRSGKA